jgi:hypothetical protein
MYIIALAYIEKYKGLDSSSKEHGSFYTTTMLSTLMDDDRFLFLSEYFLNKNIFFKHDNKLHHVDLNKDLAEIDNSRQYYLSCKMINWFNNSRNNCFLYTIF